MRTAHAAMIIACSATPVAADGVRLHATAGVTSNTADDGAYDYNGTGSVFGAEAGYVFDEHRVEASLGIVGGQYIANVYSQSSYHHVRERPTALVARGRIVSTPHITLFGGVGPALTFVKDTRGYFHYTGIHGELGAGARFPIGKRHVIELLGMLSLTTVSAEPDHENAFTIHTRAIVLDYSFRL
jgi:hypothetical protein